MPSIEHTPGNGRTYWRSLDELAGTPEFRQFVHREFPAGALDMLDSEERRHFLKIMGASLALAGFGLAGCRRWPKEVIAPFAHRPEGFTPGAAEHYATSMELAGVGAGLLVTAWDGRPTKIEGNPQHPVNRGRTDVFSQTSVLDLYDPDRSRHVMHLKEDGREQSTWEAFDAWATSHFASMGSDRGGQLAILGQATSSPSVADMKARLLAALPRARWFEYEPINNDNSQAGSVLAFGRMQRVHCAFDRAAVILSLDSDFLLMHPAMVKNTRDFADGRRVGAGRDTMSRLYVVESGLSLTGANADVRIATRSRDVAALAGRLAAMIDPELTPSAPEARHRLDQASAAVLGLRPGTLEQIAGDLNANRGRSIVLAGSRQPAEVHALAHLLNERLGNVGQTIQYTALPDTPAQGASIKALAEAIAGNTVSTLVILGGDPVYNAPADLDFGARLDSVKVTVHLSHYDNETSRRCTWHLPRATYLEAWGDCRAWDGTLGITQPLIEPLFGGRSPIEVLAAVSGDGMRRGYDIVRRTMATQMRPAEFEAAWRRTLHDGFLAGSARPLEKTAVRKGAVVGALSDLWRQWAPAEGGTLELVFVPDASVYDGRFANNGWLQELPDPLTKLTWDNAALLGLDAAKRLGVETGDLVTISLGGRAIEAAALVMPGQHPGSITLPLGYGQALGAVADGAGFNFYLLRTSGAMGFATGATVAAAGGSYVLAMTQDHHPIDSIAGKGTQERLPTIYREATLQEFEEHPDFAKHRAHVVHRLSLWDESNLQGATYAWGMTIDLNSCTGCGACIAACQAENNIPIVGKEQVKRGREMHWIRVDRYFRGHDAAWPDAVALQPVPCMMCENAPCEQVCPVAATTHDKDGLNVMIYNRCVGTRYCSNNCPYKVRRFNFFDFWTRDPRRNAEVLAVEPEYYTRPQADVDPLRRMQFNPQVTVRTRGVMEKCTYCLQRISDAKIRAKNEWVAKTPAEKAADPRVMIPDGTFTTACAQACPADAIVFGDLMDPSSRVSALQRDDRSYEMLGEINTKPRTRYLARLRNPAEEAIPAAPGEREHG